MGPPESIVQLDKTGMGGAVDVSIEAELLAPKRPAFVENGVGEHPPETAWVLILNDEL